MSGPIGAVVVDHDAGPLLEGCVSSLLADGATPVVVVENGTAGSASTALADLPGGTRMRRLCDSCAPAATSATGPGSTAAWRPWRGTRPRPNGSSCATRTWSCTPARSPRCARRSSPSPPGRWSGPRILDETGDVYPSVRNFPSFTDAAGHALLAQFDPENPFTLRYNPGTPEGDVVTGAGWVSGSCFLARRSALEELGGFDEAYFMYLEDTDLCWRAHDAGWGVGFAGTAEVTHLQGVMTARHPYRMMAAHHRSALRFTVRTTRGWRRAALPLAALVLGARLAMTTVRIAVSR